MNFKKSLSVIIAGAMAISSLGVTALADDVKMPGYSIEPLENLTVTAVSAVEAFNGNGEFTPEEITLDFGRVFKANETYDASLADSDLYNYLADFEITFSEDVTAKLAGYYSWADKHAGGNWVSLSTPEGESIEILDGVATSEGYTFKAGQTVKIMQDVFGWDNFTYSDVLAFVKEFQCGVDLSDEAYDGLIIDLKLCLYPTEWEVVDGHKQFTIVDEPIEVGNIEPFIYENADNVRTPDYEIKELEDLAVTAVAADKALNNQFDETEELTLDFGRVFTAKEQYNSLLANSALYNYLADFEITFSHDTTAKLAGYYEMAGGFTDNKWIALSASGDNKVTVGNGVATSEGYTFKAGQTVKIMQDVFGWDNFTYSDVLAFVKEFECGVVLGENTLDGTEIDLKLCLYPTTWTVEDGHKQFTIIGEPIVLGNIAPFVYDNPNAELDVDSTDEDILKAVNNIEIDSVEDYNAAVNYIGNLSDEAVKEVNAETIVALYEFENSNLAVGGNLLKAAFGEGLYAVSIVQQSAATMDMGTIYNVSVSDSEGNNVASTDFPVLMNIPTTGVVSEILYETATGDIVNLDFVQKNGYVMFGMTEFGNISIVYKTSAITVEFEQAKDDDNKDIIGLYNINLVAADGTVINRLSSADLTFAFTSDKPMDYVITPAEAITLTSIENRYMFNFNGITKPDETDTSITIGQVQFDGYGTFSFGVDSAANDTNIVNATKSKDNIVEHFVVGGGTDGKTGELMLGTGLTDITIEVPTHELKINIEFPNTIENKETKYQDMQVKVSGGDLAKDIEIALGDTCTISNVTGTDDTAEFVNGGYEIVLAKELTENTAYNVTVTGAGYRTARYTVTMTNAKTLNFWNNIKDYDKEIEKDKASSAKKITFLAGDIVKDNDINIYDLSAVVSYFGETGLSAQKNPQYAKYDLNRDGTIDSKDVAYVLASWND